MEKDEKCNGIPDPIINPNSEFVWIKFLCYTIQFSTMNRFDRSDIVIQNIDPIQYHQDAKVIPLNLQKSNFSYLWDYIPTKKRKNSIMEVNIIAFIATALFILVYTALLLGIYVKTVSQNDEFESNLNY